MAGAGRALSTLARRADFLRVAGKGKKWATAALIVQACPRPPARPADTGASMNAAEPMPPIRVGFTASKKVGKAVARNRAKRRLRALAREIIAAEAKPGYDYVLIANPRTVDEDYARLRNDLRWALRSLKLQRSQEAAQHSEGMRA